MAPRMTGTRSKAAQDRRAERGSLHRQEEPYQVSSVKLLERSECGRPATLKKEKEINALSHGYSGADCRGNERNAETDRGAGRPVGGGTPPWRKPRQSGTGVGQVGDATNTAASRKVGGHKGNRPPVKLRQRRGKELGEELPSVAEEDAELHYQSIPRSLGTARVGGNDSSAHHSSTRRPTIRLRSRSHGSSDGPGGQDAPSLCGADASDRG